ncbi:MAG: NAD-dependent epimerase/dehydratase family protein [Bacteroidales bacterium]
MRILITGIHGFVGSNLVKDLAKDNDIYGLDIICLDKDGVKQTYTWEDLERNGIPCVDVIIHLAGKAHDTKNRPEAQEYFDINTGLTQKIFDYFHASTAQKFIFFSSVKAAADFVPGDILTEEVPVNPKGPYGESKIQAEAYIKDKLGYQLNDTEFELPNGKSVYILRPCMIHGPGNKGNLNLLYSVVKKGIPWPLGAFENKRSFTSIDNLCYVIRRLVEEVNHNIPSGVYQIGDDQALSTNELIRIICSTLGQKTIILKIPKGIMSFLGNIGSVLHLPLNKERLQKLTENYVVSNEKIKKTLGVTHLPVSAKEGLIKTIKSFRK